MEKKSHTTSLLLSFFLGGLGLHRFYTGYTALGIIQILTLGGCGIWSLIDFISLCFNNYKDIEGQELENYNKTLSMILFGFWAFCFIINILGVIIKFGSVMKG